MNLLYMGYFCNETLFNTLVANGSNSSHARQQLEKKMLDGIIANLNADHLQIVSYLPRVEKVSVAEGSGEEYHGVHIEYLWCNKRSIGSVVRAIFRNIGFLRKWSRNKGHKVVLTYSTNPIHVIPALLMRKIGRYKIVTLCSEVSNFRRTDGNLIGKVSRRISSILDNSFDGYILLSKYMNEVTNLKKKPFIVMEGIAQNPLYVENLQKQPAIMYAGGLTEDNGILILLDGFLKLRRQDLRLWICGNGPLEDEVKNYAKTNQNIIYYGVLPNDSIQRMEQEAELLIAPRFSKNTFTKYSFPSKNIEYMASGTPVVLTRLQGIPDEYFQYVYVLENETTEGICSLIKEFLDTSSEDKRRFGERAKQFVLKNKNEEIQGKKILSFVQDVCRM